MSSNLTTVATRPGLGCVGVEVAITVAVSPRATTPTGAGRANGMGQPLLDERREVQGRFSEPLFKGVDQDLVDGHEPGVFVVEP